MFRKIIDSRQFVPAVLVGAFLIRLCWVLAWNNEQFIGDYIWLNERAKDLAEGEGYAQPSGEPTAFWPIGYPLSLSLLYRVFGEHEVVGKLANVIYSMGILVAVYLLGRTLFSEATGRIASLLLAISPNHIAYNSLLTTETIFTMLFALALVITFGSSKKYAGLLLGALLGVAANIKPVTLGLFPLLFLCLWAVHRNWKPAVAHTAMAAVVTAFLLLPWLIRNRTVFGKWVLTNEAGLVLLVGANPEATGQYYRATVIDEMYPKLQHGGQEEYRWNKEAQRLAIRFIQENPGHYLALGFKKLYHMYKHDVDGIWHTLNGVTPKVSDFTWNFLTRSGHLYYAGLMALVIGYLARSVVRGELLSQPNLCWLFVLYFSCVCFVFHGLPRYHYPIMPIFILFAARFIEAILRLPKDASAGRHPISEPVS